MKTHQQSPLAKLNQEQRELTLNLFLGIRAMQQFEDCRKVWDRELTSEDKKSIAQWCNEPII